MSFKCKIGLHSWNGCKCSECGITGDKQHDWSKNCEKCSKCGKIRENQHDWNVDNKICIRCGKVIPTLNAKEKTYINECLTKINITKISSLQSLNGKSIQENRYSSANHIRIVKEEINLEDLFKCIALILTETRYSIMDMEVRTDHMGLYGKAFEVKFLRLVLDRKYLDPGEERYSFGIFKTRKGLYTCLKWTDIDTD